jgi:muramoyltetrapeptide carboxypeptidase
MPERLRRPPRLAHGARVALVAPAGPIDDARLDHARSLCERLGLVPVVGAAALQRTGYLAGPDDARAADFQTAIDDDDITAIWALRGGYGTVRLLKHLDLQRMHDRPKAFMGFSDNTTLHLALLHAGVTSFHAPHAGGEFPPFTEHWFRSVLFDGAHDIALDTPDDAPLHTWRAGHATGRLVGGNLAMLTAAEGTPFAMPSHDAILFIEDVGEAPYRIDRLLMQLSLGGALKNVAGIVVGQFTDCDDATTDAHSLLRRELTALGVPVIANAPIGHVPDNWTIPYGARARIECDDNHATLTLLDAGVE